MHNATKTLLKWHTSDTIGRFTTNTLQRGQKFTWLNASGFFTFFSKPTKTANGLHIFRRQFSTWKKIIAT